MPLKDDLNAEVAKIFKTQWKETDARVVPAPEDLSLDNKAKKLEEAVVLYADMSHSTKLVDEKKWHFSAEIYKAFLHCAAKVIRSKGGEITAYDGDRIMAIYVGDTKNSSAARTALKLNYVRINIINPLIKNQYPAETYKLEHVVGIDSG